MWPVTLPAMLNGFNLHFLTANDVFMCLFATCMFSLMKCLVVWCGFCSFFILISWGCLFFFFLVLHFESSLYILDTNPLSEMWFANIFFQSIIHIFLLFTWAFIEKVFYFDEFSIYQLFFLWIVLVHLGCYNKVSQTG